MKKLLVLLGVFVLSMTLGDNYVMAAQPAEDVECVAPCIDSFEIVDGQVGSVDIADGTVDTVDITNGAVTDAKITGPISRSNLEKPSNVVVVAQSGGDFTSIQAAIDSISPSASNPYVIKVMPGTYVENIYMKSYLHLQGSGRDVTTIEALSSSLSVISLNALTDVAISGLTIKGGFYGIDNYSSSLTITGNTITGSIQWGIQNRYATDTMIAGNVISGSQVNSGINNDNSTSTITGNTIELNGLYGIQDWGFSLIKSIIMGNIIRDNSQGGISLSSPSLVQGNTITGNGQYGIYTYNSSATIRENTITGLTYGIFLAQGSATIIHNSSISNVTRDIYVSTTATSHISFNVYDTILGTPSGSYNVKSDGTPW
jgi:parallel beta-helix repeat protein